MSKKILLGDIATIQAGPFGTQLHKNEYVDTGIAMLNAKNVGNGVVLMDDVDYVMPATCDRLSNYVLKYGDILFGRAGSIDRHCFISKQYDGCFQGTNCIRVRCHDVSVAKFISYYLWLPHVKKALEAKTGGSVLSYITTDLLSTIEIIFPEASVASIEGILTTIDDKITLNDSICSNLEAMAKLLYDYWFVQFDFPDENGKPYKSSGGKMVWNDDLKREIPAGWSAATLLNNPLCSLLKPGVDVFDTKEYITTGDVNGLSISQGSLIDYETRENRANMQPVVNSVWFAKMKNSIKHLFVDDAFMTVGRNMIFSTGFCGLACSDDSFEYVATYIHDPLFETVKDMNSHGATMAGVNNDDLDNISLLVPSTDVLSMFHEKTHSIFELFSECLIENRNLSSLRDFLLPMLMNGQVKVGKVGA